MLKVVCIFLFTYLTFSQTQLSQKDVKIFGGRKATSKEHPYSNFFKI